MNLEVKSRRLAKAGLTAIILGTITVAAINYKPIYSFIMLEKHETGNSETGSVHYRKRFGTHKGKPHGRSASWKDGEIFFQGEFRNGGYWNGVWSFWNSDSSGFSKENLTLQHKYENGKLVYQKNSPPWWDPITGIEK